MSTGTINHDLSKENNKLVTLSIVLTALFLIVVIISSLYYFKAMVSAESNHKQEVAKRSASLIKLEKEYNKNLNSLKWIDKSKGTLIIPIDMAMENVVKDYSN